MRAAQNILTWNDKNKIYIPSHASSDRAVAISFIWTESGNYVFKNCDAICVLEFCSPPN